VRRTLEYLPGWPLFDDLPSIHHRDFIADAARYGEIMRDNEQCDAERRSKRFKKLEHTDDERRIERAHGLIANKDAWGRGKCTGNRSALALTS